MASGRGRREELERRANRLRIFSLRGSSRSTGKAIHVSVRLVSGVGTGGSGVGVGVTAGVTWDCKTGRPGLDEWLTAWQKTTAPHCQARARSAIRTVRASYGVKLRAQSVQLSSALSPVLSLPTHLAAGIGDGSSTRVTHVAPPAATTVRPRAVQPRVRRVVPSCPQRNERYTLGFPGRRHQCSPSSTCNGPANAPIWSGSVSVWRKSSLSRDHSPA